MGSLIQGPLSLGGAPGMLPGGFARPLGPGERAPGNLAEYCCTGTQAVSRTISAYHLAGLAYASRRCNPLPGPRGFGRAFWKPGTPRLGYPPPEPGTDRSSVQRRCPSLILHDDLGEVKEGKMGRWVQSPGGQEGGKAQPACFLPSPSPPLSLLHDAYVRAFPPSPETGTLEQCRLWNVPPSRQNGTRRAPNDPSSASRLVHESPEIRHLSRRPPPPGSRVSFRRRPSARNLSGPTARGRGEARHGTFKPPSAARAAAE
jgi:hypothetical protein